MYILIKKIILLFIFFSLASCSLSEFQAKMVRNYEKIRLLKKFNDYSLSNELSSKKFVVVGMLKIFFNGIDITDLCHFSFKSGEDKYGHLLDESGKFIISLDNENVYLYNVYCIVGNKTPRFNYYFARKDINLFSQLNIASRFDIYFSNKKEKKDNCSSLNFNDIKIDSIEYHEKLIELSESYKYSKLDFSVCES